jgi:hypothetical protein
MEKREKKQSVAAARPPRSRCCDCRLASSFYLYLVMSHDADISVFYLYKQPQSLTPEIFIRARIPC